MGRDVFDNLDGVGQILRILRERFAPDAIDSILQDMIKFLYFKRTEQTMDTYIMEFEISRGKAEPPVLMGSRFPDALVSVLCMQNAALSKNEKTMALASLGNTLAFPLVSARMRRLFGPCGYASRQDVMVAQDMDTVSEEEDFEAWVAYRKAKRATRGNGEPNRRAKAEVGDSGGREKGGRTKNPVGRRTGRRNRRYTCDSEYHYAPQCPLKTSRKSNKPYSSMAMETPIEVGSPLKSAPAGPARSQEQSFPTTIQVGGLGQSESVVVWDTRATANLVCYKWSENHNYFLGRKGLEKAVSYPPNARFIFGGGNW